MPECRCSKLAQAHGLHDSVACVTQDRDHWESMARELREAIDLLPKTARPLGRALARFDLMTKEQGDDHL